MRTLVLEMPVDVAAALRVPQPEQQGRLKQELAVRLYQKRMLDALQQQGGFRLSRALYLEAVAVVGEYE